MQIVLLNTPQTKSGGFQLNPSFFVGSFRRCRSRRVIWDIRSTPFIKEVIEFEHQNDSIRDFMNRDHLRNFWIFLGDFFIIPRKPIIPWTWCLRNVTLTQHVNPYEVVFLRDGLKRTLSISHLNSTRNILLSVLVYGIVLAIFKYFSF